MLKPLRFIQATIAICCILISSPSSSVEVIYQDHNPYFSKLLQLALEKTVATYGTYTMTVFPENAQKERVRKMLIKGDGISVIYSTTNKKREKEFKAIKFPLLKNLNEYRFLLIRKDEQSRFDGIKTLKDLRNFKAGSGTYWHDTAIFRQNDLPVVTSLQNDSLLRMLAAKRFDYVARGAYEIWDEAADTSFGDFEVERCVLLHYNAGYYFFVNKDNTLLAERIEQGLKIAEADGSFDKLFFSFPSYKKGWEAIHQHNRMLIELENIDDSL